MAIPQSERIGMQPAQVQFHPAPRAAGSQIKPPLTRKLRQGPTKIELLERALLAEARVLELEAEIERLRPPF